MSKTVISKDSLIKSAKEIVLEEGTEKLNMRSLAQRCGIGTGSAYNYFSSKGDLLVAVVEDFWRNIFQTEIAKLPIDINFTSYLKFLYDVLNSHLVEFKRIYSSSLAVLNADEKQQGKAIEKNCLFYIEQQMLEVMKNDENIVASVWTETFTQEKFIRFLFDNMIAILTKNEEAFDFLIEIVNKTLYI